MAGDSDGGAYDPYAPRASSTPKKRGKRPDLKVVAAVLDGADAPPAGHANLDDVAAAVKDAEGEDKLLSIGAGDPYPGGKFMGMAPGGWKPDEYGLPPGCPVLPLGTEDGMFFFLDTIGQMRALSDGDLGQAGINALFMGRHWWLYWAFPKVSKEGAVTSWRPEKAREVLMGACARKGPWNSADRVRGRGIWRGKDGRLILHCGDRLFSNRGEEPLGELEGMVYPTRPPIARPWPVPLADKPGPALKLLPHFETWNWRRKKLDPILLIGWIAVGFLSGSLDWRPAAFLLGDKGTGKSSLQRDIRGLYGHAMIRSGDATKAGISQKLKFDCIAVALDEFEAVADPRRKKEILDLARMCASGDDILRGGDNHKGTEFSGRSPFLFSAINSPPLDPQDLSRLALLGLRKLTPGKVKPDIPADELAELGRKIMRRLMDEWHRWPATLAAWKSFLASCGHDGRGQDTFGSLLAAADLLIGADAVALELELGPNATSAENPYEAWRPLLTVTSLAEYDDQTPNWRLCLSHILSQRIEAWRGGKRHTVGEVITELWEASVTDPDVITYRTARELLEQTGLTILRPKDRFDGYELFVPFQHPLLFELMRGSKWQGEINAGAWTNALRQAEDEDGNEIWRPASARLHGEKKKGTSFAFAAILVSEAAAKDDDQEDAPP